MKSLDYAIHQKLSESSENLQSSYDGKSSSKGFSVSCCEAFGSHVQEVLRETRVEEDSLPRNSIKTERTASKRGR